MGGGYGGSGYSGGYPGQQGTGFPGAQPGYQHGGPGPQGAPGAYGGQPGYGAAPQPGPYGGPAPYGQPGQYGAPPQQWGAPPQQYGQYGAPGGYGYGQQPATRDDLAPWSQRALGGLIDYIAPIGIAYLVVIVGTAARSALLSLLGTLLIFVAIGFIIWNSYRGGVTGQTVGRKYAKVKLIKEETGQPIGGGMGVARYFCHVLEVGIGWFAPLFTEKKQTFADMVLGTVVVKADG
jgi:uncharacterized RDD family membrane protein YckC